MLSFFGKHKKTRNGFLYISISVFLFVQMAGYLLLPGAVYASPVTDAGNTSLSGAQLGQQIDSIAETKAERVKREVENVLLGTLLGALINGVSYLTRKIAYDGAKYLASGGKGQSAQVFQDGFGPYLAKTASDAAASAIDDLGAPLGLGLCRPPDIKFQLYLQVGLRFQNGSPTPNCTWSELSTNWGDPESWKAYADRNFSNFKSPEAFFSSAVQTHQNDFSLGLGAMVQIEGIQLEAKEAQLLNRIEGQGFKAVTDFISGNVKTPGQIIKKESEALTANENTKITSQQVAGIYGTAAKQIIPSAASTFVSTFLQELLKNLFDSSSGGLVPTNRDSATAQNNSFFASPASGNRRAAERAFSFLLATNPSRINNYDTITTFHACPQNPGLNNCVIDSGLFDALVRAQQGQERLTIKEAMDQGLLHADWPLIPPTRSAENADARNCKDTGYCYSNIQKLRREGILPLGFEIAVLRSDPDNPTKLGTVVDNFYNCAPRNPDGSAVADNAFPYCNLIDPNWILKAPVARCEANVFGPQLLGDNTNIRAEECVDTTTCVSFDEGGNCTDYGHCLRSENTWVFPGESCEPQYATCKTYQNTNTGESVAYLSRTLDFGSCDADSAGCRAYSREQIDNNDWISTGDVQEGRLPLGDVEEYQAAGRSPVIHLNDLAASLECPPGAEGCRALSVAVEDEGTGALSYGPITNVRVAPPHLNCYDTDRTTPATEYPLTRPELQLIEGSERCEEFPSVCIPAEVGCDGYTSLSDGGFVPGIVGANACNQECVGYDVFSQQESEFEGAVDPLYFVESAAVTCAPQHLGCAEFTNLDELDRGGESRQYYTKIKYCEKPEGENRDNEKTFYTWEGSVTEGYTLKIHKLKVVDTAEADIIDRLTSIAGAAQAALAVIGSPAYAELTTESLVDNYEQCNEVAYDNLINGRPNAADPDCREFFDDVGNSYYRLLEHTVTVSDLCVPLRSSEANLYIDSALDSQTCIDAMGFWDTDANQCQRCYGGGHYVEGSCVYNGIAAESTQCPAAANGCRLYDGNFSGNIDQLVFHDMEPAEDTANALNELVEEVTGVTAGDPNINVVGESIQLGGYSLRILNNSQWVISIDENAFGRIDYEVDTLELRFWAKGQGNIPTFELISSSNNYPFSTASDVQSLGDSWRQYTIGPVSIPEAAQDADASLILVSSGGSQYYIDNIELIRKPGGVPLIKDSWKTQDGYDAPLTCDSNPTDAFPGEQLGCDAYGEQSSGNTVFATGFEQLCRPEAIGCRGFYDTHNTVEQGATLYNVWCQSQTNGASTCAGSLFGSEEVSCNIPSGAEGCYIPKVVLPATATLSAAQITLSNGAAASAGSDKLVILSSTIVIPADTPEADPFYLAVQQQHACDGSQYLGCEQVGLETQVLPDQISDAYEFTSQYVVNNPSSYDLSLCREEERGCIAYQSEQSLVYFKDPALIGGKSCVYKEDATGGLGESGWFLDGVGRCNNDPEQLCKSAAECGPGGSCDDIGGVACYDNFIVQGGEYGIHSNSSEAYEEYVGICPVEQNLCMEFIDKDDRGGGTRPNGTPYYYIFDESITSRIGECQGQVSQKEGCVLFDQTENPQQLYNTRATYRESQDALESNRDSFVLPNTSPIRDANIILKVDRDRQCSEWLACKNSITYTNSDGVPTDYCFEFAKCDRSNGDRCTSFTDDTGSFASQKLTWEQYVGRDTGWNGEEYLGYSLYNKYPVQNYVYTPIDDDISGTYIFYEVPNKFLRVPDVPTGVDFDCRTDDGAPRGRNWNTVCGIDQQGRCYEGSCLYPVNGTFPAELDQSTLSGIARDTFESSICKAYPEETSPFPQTVLSGAYDEKTYKRGDTSFYRRSFPNKQEAFVGADICQTGNCSCEYQKITQSNGDVDYWPLREFRVPRAICIGGPHDGAPCEIDPNEPNSSGFNDACGGAETGGICKEATKIDKRIGTLGFCLEYDQSRPILGGAGFACLTWFPLQLSATENDLFNQFLEAGYYPVPEYDAPYGGGQIYCSQSTGRGAGYLDLDKDAGLRNTASTRPTTRDELADSYISGYGNERIFSDIFNIYDWLPNYRLPAPNAYKDCTTARSQSTPAGGYEEILCATKITSSEIAQASVVGAVKNAEQKKAYTMMQAWGWYNLGTDAALLRMEFPTNVMPQHLNVDTCDSFCSSYTGVQTGFFSTGMRQLKMGASTNLGGTYSGQGYIDYFRVGQNDSNPSDGEDWLWISPTFFHGPRIWGSYTYPPGSNVGIPVLHTVEDAKFTFTGPWDGVERAGSTADSIPRILYTGSHGAEINNNFSVPDTLYESPVQETLLEHEIDTIYFVPTMYTEGSLSSAHMPGFLSVDFNIPIGTLRRAVEGNEVRASQRIDNVERPGVGGVKSSNTIPGTTAGIDDAVRALRNPATYEFFAENTECTNCNVLSYVLERTSSASNCYNLVSFCDYGSSDVGYEFKSTEINERWNGEIVTAPATEHPRNEVYRRYVSVFFDERNQNGILNFSVSGAPANDGQDVFSVPCVVNERTNVNFEDDPGNAQYETSGWYAIGMDFNKDGEFLGYISRSCNDQGHMTFATFATFYERCTEYALVYDETEEVDAGNTNKAWTDHMWRGTGDLFFPNELAPNIKQGIWRPPYGATGLAVSDLDKRKTLMQHVFDARTEGIPYACHTQFVGTGAPNLIDIFVSLYTSPITDPNLAYACDSLERATGGDGFSKDLTTSVGGAMWYQRGRGINLLTDLHQRIFKLIGFKFDEGFDTEQLETKRAYDTSYSDIDGGPAKIDGTRSPRIFSVAWSTGLPAEMYNMSINGWNGTITDFDDDGVPENDLNSNGIPDNLGLVRFGSYTARMRFYGFVDDNRMPIKRVLVNWGDVGGLGLQVSSKGFYKNRKPWCGDTIGECYSGDRLSPTYTGVTCTTDEHCKDLSGLTSAPGTFHCSIGSGSFEVPDDEQNPKFGNSSRACQPGVFEYTHTYGCEVEDLDDPNIGFQVDKTAPGADPTALDVGDVANEDVQQALLLVNVPGATKVCVYKPKVQIQDNWGFCNGSVDPENGNYNFQYYQDYDSDPLDDNNAPDVFLCKPDDKRAWTYFKGEIVVVPT